MNWRKKLKIIKATKWESWVINPIIKLHIFSLLNASSESTNVSYTKRTASHFFCSRIRRDKFCLIINILSQFPSRRHVSQCNACNIKNHPPSTICLNFLVLKEILCESHKFWIFPQIRSFCATPALISRSRFVDRIFCSNKRPYGAEWNGK